MILIAPDKYRGTMSAPSACRTIDGAVRRALPGVETLIVPMADGGEGTAACVASDAGWIDKGRYRINPLTGEAVVDCADVIGHGDFAGIPPGDRTSEAMGHVINKIWHLHRPRRIYVGVGGTGCCDGGEGFLRTVDRDVSKVLIGLVDVRVPLLPIYPGGPSALMFAPQKGFTTPMMASLVRRLESVVAGYGPAVSPFDGAGGGMGYALASVLGCTCHSGAEWIVDRADIDWQRIELAITGEGCYDDQSSCGKVVDVISRRAAGHSVPTVVFAGCIGKPGRKDSDLLRIVDCSRYESHAELTPEVARRRMTMAVENKLS